MLIFWILLSLCAAAANAACDDCPTNGIWSSWTTTESCATTCGACSSISYTRTCLSTDLGCTCVGNTTKTDVCNTQACNYPRTGGSGVTCCVGTPMVYNNWYHCGPLSLNTSLSCCPSGGYWGLWSTWSKATDQVAWNRTRTCVSDAVSCPCTGDSVQTLYTCPCTTISMITSSNNPCSSVLSGKTPFTARAPVHVLSECKAIFVLEASNLRQYFYTADSSGNYYTNVGVVDSSGDCQAVKFYTGNAKTNGQFYKFTLTCDISTGYYTGNYLTTNFTTVAAIGQFY